MELPKASIFHRYRGMKHVYTVCGMLLALLIAFAVFGCTTFSRNDTCVVYSRLKRVTIRDAEGTNKWHKCIEIVLSNRGNMAVWVFPSDVSISYSLRHANGTYDFDMWARLSTTSSGGLIDIPVHPVLVRPKIEETITLMSTRESGKALPELGTGHLKVEFTLSPFYKDKLYYGIPIYRKEMQFETDVRIEGGTVPWERVILPAELERHD